MPRPRYLARISPDTLSRLCARRSWPPALLAELMGCHRTTIYRHFRQSPVATEDVMDAILMYRHTPSAASRTRGER